MTEIRHFVVLMLENRSFDCMLGTLYPKSDAFDGLAGTESNQWRGDGSIETVTVWNDPRITPQGACIPDPDPGESFDDIAMQIHGVPAGAPSMGGFVANYMQQPASDVPADPRAVMHYFSPAQMPMISTLAKAFAVSDRWHASAPCQTWPNRFFAHAGTAGGQENNAPGHLFEMPTVFNLLSAADRPWRVYFHDFPQCAALTRLWPHLLTHFSRFEDFVRDAAAGTLPAYSFIEPRYFADPVPGVMPNDEHPPHDVAYGEALIAEVYNAVRAGPGWKDTVLLVTYDEHGGCFDHVSPPAAAPPGDVASNSYRFDTLGVRVPAVIVSPYVAAGGVWRPKDGGCFDHTSIIATIRDFFGTGSLTPRDAAAPSLASLLAASPDNDGPPRLVAPAPPATFEEVARAAGRPPNDLQRSLTHVATRLPTAGAELGAHLASLRGVLGSAPRHATAGSALADVAAHLRRALRL